MKVIDPKTEKPMSPSSRSDSPKEKPNYLDKNLRAFPFKLVFFYALFSILWITFSDKLLEIFVSNLHQLTTIQTYKGWFYVFTSSSFIFFFSIKLIKTAVKEAQSLNWRLIDEAPDAIVLLDTTTGKFFYQNPAAEKLFGYSNEEMKRLSPIDISPEFQWMEPDLKLLHLKK